MLFRLLLLGALGYFGYQFLKGVFTGSRSKPEVRGQPGNPPLDLRDADVEDARFEELDEKE
ncbi:MAG TPA: hypothetical protein ENN17_04275 [bacterium]|nr:hypothetical protein [bacterium]